jgi:hypothetical protein
MKYIDRIEVKNGLDTGIGNNFAESIAQHYGKKISGGSDAHTKSFIGNVFTHNSCARTKTDFLEALREGDVEVSGLDLNLDRILRKIYEFACSSLLVDILLNPHKRDRKIYQKYFLDQFITLTAIFPLLVTVLPPVFISYIHEKMRDKQTLKLLKELQREFFSNNDSKLHIQKAGVLQELKTSQ